MLWSILIPGIPERFHTVKPLLHTLLEKQNVARMPDVELLYLMDNKRRPVGAKRNDLLGMARGEYVSFIDDDDDVSPEYVDRIYKTIALARKQDTPTDVICFPQRAIIKQHGVKHECTYSIRHWKDRKPEARRVLAHRLDDKGAQVPDVLNWTGPPAHTMAWRREVVKDVAFPEKNFGEDTSWVDACCEKATTEIVLDGDALYYYNFNEETSATR